MTKRIRNTCNLVCAVVAPSLWQSMSALQSVLAMSYFLDTDHACFHNVSSHGIIKASGLNCV